MHDFRRGYRKMAYTCFFSHIISRTHKLLSFLEEAREKGIEHQILALIRETSYAHFLCRLPRHRLQKRCFFPTQVIFTACQSHSRGCCSGTSLQPSTHIHGVGFTINNNINNDNNLHLLESSFFGHTWECLTFFIPFNSHVH